MITITKCPCGRCDDWHLVGIGYFTQGSGFTKEEAERIASLLNMDEVFRDHSKQCSQHKREVIDVLVERIIDAERKS